MPLTFIKKNPLAKKSATETAKPVGTSHQGNGAQHAAPATKSNIPSFMKKGAAAKQVVAEEEARQEQRRAERDKMWRFYMPPEEERKITFLDGEVDGDGMLDVPIYYEHQMKVNGRWENFVCTEEQAGYCPLCDRGDIRKYLVGAMTVLDHSKHVIKTGPNAGKTIENTRKLFIAKQQTMKILTKIALKRGGLTGATFDVSRGDDKSASVGSQFDFTEKHEVSELPEVFGLKAEDCAPADYDKEITYLPPETLVELGLGKMPTGPGYEKPSGSTAAKPKLANAL